MNQWTRSLLRLPLFVLLLSTAGCAGGGLGTIADVLGGIGGMGGAGGGGQQQVSGEIQQVDERNQQLYLRTQGGEGAWIRYDSRTQVIYQQQQYPVSALDPGDFVAMRLQRSNNNQYYTDYIQVQQSVQERTGGGGGGDTYAQRFEGRVGGVDYQRGIFQLRTSYETYTVTLPYNPTSSMRDRFQRLRQGDAVRIEGTLLQQNRIELYRFY